MSWQKRSIKLILGLPLSLPIISYAVNIGDTYVQSQQNQPLNATINVTDVDPADFSVKIANPDTYRQLGLSKDTDINVRFEPTSSNGGKIVMTTTQPVASPFTDVVLDINNKGDVKTLPKTLLMPIDNSQAIITQSETSLVEIEPAPIVVGQDNQVQLPAVSAEPTIVEEPIITATPNVEQLAIDTPEITPPIQTATVEPLVEKTLNKQRTDHLVVEEKRLVYPAGATPAPLPPLTEQPIAPLQTQDKPATADEVSVATTTDNTAQTDGSTVTYVIQRNDNLWTIANQLAKQNNKNVNDMMKEIVEANPMAFKNNDPSKLQVNAELEIPKYEVMPSQLGAKSANEARQTAKKQTTAKKSSKKDSYKATKPKHTTTTVKKQTVKKPTTRKKSEMQIIAPSQTAGSAQGSKKGSNQGSGTTPVVNQVQQKRQATAQKASKVSSLNQSLMDAEKRLKMQNAKLAQLEQRLKELNKK